MIGVVKYTLRFHRGLKKECRNKCIYSPPFGYEKRNEKQEEFTAEVTAS